MFMAHNDHSRPVEFSDSAWNQSPVKSPRKASDTYKYVGRTVNSEVKICKSRFWRRPSFKPTQFSHWELCDQIEPQFC